MNNTVVFKVQDSGLSSYIQEIQKKSDTLTNSAIKGAIEQVNRGKEVLKVIDDQIRLVEKKSRIETAAARSIFLEQREAELKYNRDKHAGLANDVYSNNKLTETEKKEKLNAIAGTEKEGEERIKNNYRENLTVAKEQERQSKIQTSLARENIDALKQTAKENVKTIINGDLKLSDVIKGAASDEQKLVAKLTEEELNKEKKIQAKEGGGGKSIIGGILAADNINKLLTSAGQLTSTQNGFDMIKPASSMAGRIIGGIIGGLVGTLIEPGGGTAAGATIGASLGGTIGETSGELLSRTAIAKQEYLRTTGRWNAITGTNLPDYENTENIGINATDFLKLQTGFARMRGNSSDAVNTARESLYADKGYGVDQGTSALLVELQRSSREGNKDLGLLIGGILQKGDGTMFKNGDHTFLNEFLGKFTTLQKELLKTQSTVASGTTMDIFSRFNKLGGEWDARDPRSQANINAIQAGLSNPGSDNLKALSFSVLRKQMPNSSIFDLLAERQKGLGSSSYLKSMLGTIDQLGGDDSNKQLNLSGMFPGLSLSAVKRLFQHKDQLMSGGISVDELRSKYKGDFQSRAEENTPLIDKNMAGIDNSLLKDVFSSIDEMGDAISEAIKFSLSGAVIEMKDGNKIHFVQNGARIAKNNTKKNTHSVDIIRENGINPNTMTPIRSHIE